MTQPLTWVIGAGGLLGSHLTQALQAQRARTMVRKIPWHDPDATRSALREGIRDLIHGADGAAWNIAWCAGVGVVATKTDPLKAETAVFTAFLRDLADDAQPGGAFFLSSSAGGAYAGSPNPRPYTEHSTPRPLAPYGVEKLVMEAELRAFASATGTATLIGRIANLYGPGQDLAKGQGMVSQLCLSHVTRQPAIVYVSLDTLRDYIFAADCAGMVTAGLRGVRKYVANQASPVVTKIFASGHAHTIGALIAESARVFHRRPPVVVKAPSAPGQARDLRLRSVEWLDLDRHVRTPMAVGMAATGRHVARESWAHRGPRAPLRWSPTATDYPPSRN